LGRGREGRKKRKWKRKGIEEEQEGQERVYTKWNMRGGDGKE